MSKSDIDLIETIANEALQKERAMNADIRRALRRIVTKSSDIRNGEVALRAALGQLMDQVEQMKGMFPDEDGAIARASADADAALNSAGVGAEKPSDAGDELRVKFRDFLEGGAG